MQKISLFLLRQRHPSIFITFLSTGILVGVALALLPSTINFSGLSWSIFAVILLTFCFWKRLTWLLSLTIIAGILIGIARAVPTQQQLLAYRSLIGQTVNIQGKIGEDVTLGKHSDQQIKLVQVQINGQKLPGTIWLSTTNKLQLKRGFEITAQGKLNKGFGNFSASVFRAEIIDTKDVHRDKAREARDWFADGVRDAIPEPEASLGIGYLVGQRSSLPDNFQQWLTIVGLTHVVVASGYNLTILVRFARRIFAPISKYLATLLGSLMIGGFMLVTGFSPSMSRAGLVAGLSLATWYYGRNMHPLVLLPLAAAITVLINPSFMWGDLGWYLSFAAFSGVMLLAPLLQHYFFGPKKPGSIRQILGETISAQLVTIPIIVLSFGTVAVFALPANLMVLPFVPLAMALVFVAGLAGLLLTSLAGAVGLPAYWLLHYMTSVVQWLATIPNANIKVSFGVAGVIISYILLIIFAIALQRMTKHDFRKDNLIE